MQLPDVLRLAARLVPGVGELEIRQVGASGVNATYRVLRDGHAYALRVRGAKEPEPGADPVWECRVSQWAATAQLAPALVYCDPALGVQITRWVDGRAPPTAQMCVPARIAQVAALIGRIHAVPAPARARTADPAAWVAHYQEILRGAGAIAGAEAAAGAAEKRDADAARLAAIADMRQAAGARFAALARLPKAVAVLCHGDLHVGNVIETARGLLALDWEYAHVSDPLWDLAGWSSANDFDGGLRLALLESYCGRAPTQDELARLHLLAWLFDYVCLLWSEAYLARYPDRPVDGIAARSQLLWARL